MRSRISIRGCVRPSVLWSVRPSVCLSVGRSHSSRNLEKTPILSKMKVSEGMKRKSMTIGTTFNSYKYTSKSKNAINSTNWSTSPLENASYCRTLFDLLYLLPLSIFSKCSYFPSAVPSNRCTVPLNMYASCFLTKHAISMNTAELVALRYSAMWLRDIENCNTTAWKNNSIEHPLQRCWGRVRPNSMFIDIFSKSSWIDVSYAVCNTRVRSQLLPQITLESIILNLFYFKTYCFVVYLVSLERARPRLFKSRLSIAITCI